MSTLRVKLDIEKLAATLVYSGYTYISVYQLARILGITTRTAGRILAEMERKGLVSRWSRRTYKLDVARALAGETFAQTSEACPSNSRTPPAA
ncbi:helix-turn-helix domain-containing protein [Hyperthermus butylicus]|uniref:helix-turn-helix domain-containing protein n=1 Tax=Hyperthermus butylicus TaxID=54248 RepID=UPI000325131B|nr:helix-turn-helix domain-containing protein [Hyperthermus butylicus]